MKKNANVEGAAIKTRKTKQSKVSAKKNAAESASTETETVNVDVKPTFPPYDEEAWKWMASQSIPGAFSPIMYIGQEVSRSIADILGRPMTLEEAQYLVRVDGPFVMCASEDVEFQPIEYVFRVPPGLKDKIAAGQKLTEVELITGGAFYVDHKKGVAVALSGSVFQYNNRAMRYEWCKSSPLVIAAEESKKVAGYMKWGSPSHQVQNILDAISRSRGRRDKISGLMSSLVAPRPQRRFGNNVGDQVEDGLRRSKKDHHNGSRRERELQEN